MKKILPFVFFSFLLTLLPAEEAFFFEGSDDTPSDDDFFSLFSDSETEELIDSSVEDLDSLFFTATDIDEAVVTQKEETKTSEKTKTAQKPAKSFEAKPLTFTGNLASSFGAASIFLDGENDTNTGYFDFYNYIYLLARPDPDFSVRAQFSTKLPLTSGSSPIALSSLYFDCLFKDSLYITVGKKTTSWGYPRLFTHNSDQSLSGTAVAGRPLSATSVNNTDILGDSSSGTSVLLRYPLWTGTLSAFALYKGTGTSNLKMEDVSYALSCEMLFGKTSVNAFARFNPDENSNIVKERIKDNAKGILYVPHCAGLEAKRTIFGFDLYAQWITDFKRPTSLINAFSEDDVLQRNLITGGFYKIWDIGLRELAFNAEYQADYKVFSDEDFTSDTEDEGLHNRMIIITGFKKLGSRRNISAGVEWYHDFTDESGYVKPGVNVSKIFPNIDWKTGAKLSYGSLAPKGSWSQLTLGTYLKISFNY